MLGRCLLIGSFLAASTVLAAAAQSPNNSIDPASTAKVRPSATSSENGSIRVAQNCGWFAISVCSKRYRNAQDAVDEWGGGYVVDTDDSDYPNFSGGWYCAVSGPKTKHAASSTAKGMRNAGVSSSAYIKHSCG